MSSTDRMFVKITGPGRYQVKPYSGAGWRALGIFIPVQAGILSLLFISELLEQWWLVIGLEMAVTIAFLIFVINAAVPIEQAERGRKTERRPRR